MADHEILARALFELRQAFVIAVGDKSPFAKCALEKVDAAMKAYTDSCEIRSTSYLIEVGPSLSPIKFVELRSFEEVWKDCMVKGWQYGEDALENVRFGYELAKAEIKMRSAS